MTFPETQPVALSRLATPGGCGRRAFLNPLSGQRMCAAPSAAGERPVIARKRPAALDPSFPQHVHRADQQILI